MSDEKKFIYFPSFSSKSSILKKDDFKLGDLPTIRFYDDKYPEKFRHKFFLLTAGAFYKQKANTRQSLGMEDTFILGDSGGFQIASGAIKYLGEPVAFQEQIRETIFHWLEDNSDLAMNLDIPPKIKLAGEYETALKYSIENFKYFEKKQTGKTKFLNVLQMGNALETYDKWYNAAKDFEFKGWGIGGTTKQYYNAIYVMAMFLKNKELDKKNIEYLHFLGTTSPFNFLIYAAFQKNLNKYYPHCTITTDSSTPLMQGVYGNWYHSLNYNKLNWKQLYFGNKGKTKYTEHEKLPCALNCPVCQNITFNEIANYKVLSEYMLYVGWHNLAVFNKGLDEISDLVYCHQDGGVLEIMFPKDILSLLKSIDDMFEDPKNAMVIFSRNEKNYQKLSNLMTLSTDKSILNSSLFTDGTEEIDEEDEADRDSELADIKKYEIE
jgi:queuine/archaeosine tRNA-ribosyltransferase